MPWTVADVEGHKKGLSDKQKETWVKVANSALSRCMEAGDKDCEGSAIRQANSVVDKNFSYEEYALTQTFNIQGIEIFAAGTWHGQNSPPEGDTFTEKDLDGIVSAFDVVGFEPPLKLGHNAEQEKGLIKDGHPALGWVSKVYRQGNKILANFKELPQKLYEAIKRGNYKRVSSELFFGYRSNGKRFDYVLRAVAFLGADIPAVTTTAAIAELYGEGGGEYRAYDGEGVENHKEDPMPDELKEKNAELKTQKDQILKLEQEKTDAEKRASDAEAMKKEADTKLSKREAEVRASEVKAYVDGKVKEGKVLPRFEEETRQLLLSASDEGKVFSFTHEGNTVELSQRKTVERLIEALPKMVEFKETAKVGDTDQLIGDFSTPAEAGVEIDRLTKLYMDEHDKVSYDNAKSKVLAANEDLKRVYADV